MAGKMARKKPDTARAKAPVIKTTTEEALTEDAALPETLASSDTSQPDEAAPCNRSHTPTHGPGRPSASWSTPART